MVTLQDRLWGNFMNKSWLLADTDFRFLLYQQFAIVRLKVVIDFTGFKIVNAVPNVKEFFASALMASETTSAQSQSIR